MADDIKRLNYFNGQFLREKDFSDEQSYHLQHQRDHARLLHTPGIASGLDVPDPAMGASSVTVQSGVAYDDLGRRMVLADNKVMDLSAFTAGQPVYLTITYKEVASDLTNETGISGNTRQTEAPLVEASLAAPSSPTQNILLAKVNRTGTTVDTIDRSARLHAGAKGGELTANSLTLTSDTVAPSGWAKLQLTTSHQTVLDASLQVTGTITGTLGASLVNTTQLVDGAVTTAKLADGAVTAAKIADLNVNTADLADLSVTNAKLAAAAVTGAKIANLTVATGNLADLSVTTAKLANLSVGTTQLADLSVTTAKLANLSVGTAQLADSSVTGLKLAGASVATGHIVDGSVITTKIANQAVGTAQIADGAVTAAKIADLNVNTADLADLSVTNAKLAAAAVTGAKIANLTVATGNLADAAVTGAKIANLTVATVNLADASVTGVKIAGLSVSTGHLVDASVTGTKLAGGAVSSGHIVDGAVIGGKLGPGAVGTGNLVDNVITVAKMGPSSVATNQLVDNTVTVTKLKKNQWWDISTTVAASATYQLGFYTTAGRASNTLTDAVPTSPNGSITVTEAWNSDSAGTPIHWTYFKNNSSTAAVTISIRIYELLWT